jgi:hypothetical protein
LLVATAGKETPWTTTTRMLLFSAATYLVSPVDVDVYLAGEPPPADVVAEIRLPWPAVVVLFGADFQIPRGRLGLLPHSTAEDLERLPYDRYLTLGRTKGLSLFGVVLLADDDQRCRDEVGWLIRAGADDAFARTLVPGSRHRSPLAPALGNIDAAVCWAGWDPTDDSPPEVRHTRRRRARRTQPANAAAQPVVIKSARRVRRVGRGVGGATAPHQRRGHWRRQRIGPRDEWHYEPRWIPPTIVGGHVASDQPGRVYRIDF